jgi:Fe2+ or Zn2+ uptake regulation protein
VRTTFDAEPLPRGAALRATRPRVAVLTAVHEHPHADTDSCGDVADVDCAVGGTPCLTASDDHGYAIDDAEAVYWGLCPVCLLSADS